MPASLEEECPAAVHKEQRLWVWGPCPPPQPKGVPLCLPVGRDAGHGVPSSPALSVALGYPRGMVLAGDIQEAGKT